jgi:hypothetical protein
VLNYRQFRALLDEIESNLSTQAARTSSDRPYAAFRDSVHGRCGHLKFDRSFKC